MIPTCRSNNSFFRPLRGIAARCLLAAIPLAIAPAAHAAYNLTFVTDPTGTGVINLQGINNSGTIAGFDNGVTNQGFTPNQGFTLTLPNNFTAENFPGAASTQVTGINAAGDLSGTYVDANYPHLFTKIGGVFKTLDNPSPEDLYYGLALGGINNADETVGYYVPADAGPPNPAVAFSEKGGVFTYLLPNLNSQAWGINSAATPWIVGSYRDAVFAQPFGFLDVGGAITTIDPFGSTSTMALGVNDLGEIVGFYVDSDGNQHGYIDNNGVFTSFDPPGSRSTTINGINDKGDIVGFYTDPQFNVDGFVGSPVPEPVPEPSTWAMMLAGFAGLGLLGYRKARRGALAAPLDRRHSILVARPVRATASTRGPRRQCVSLGR
jgi:hypothetical protein